jgi:hypothetical protein
MTICGVKSFLEILGPILGFLAAAAWMTSAWYGLKPLTYEALETTMPKQSRWNGYAALLAALSAIAQVSTTVMPVCRAFG